MMAQIVTAATETWLTCNLARTDLVVNLGSTPKPGQFDLLC